MPGSPMYLSFITFSIIENLPLFMWFFCLPSSALDSNHLEERKWWSHSCLLWYFALHACVLVIAQLGSLLLNNRLFGPIKGWGTILTNIDQQKAKDFEDWLTKQKSSKLKNRNMKINPEMVFLRFGIWSKTTRLLTIVTYSWVPFLTSMNELIVYLFQLYFCNNDSA